MSEIFDVIFEVNDVDMVVSLLEFSRFDKLAKHIKEEFKLSEFPGGLVSSLAKSANELKLDRFISAILVGDDDGEDIFFCDIDHSGEDRPVMFQYDDISKKIFLATKSRTWFTFSTMENAVSTFVSAEEFEVRFDKSVTEFEDFEIEFSVKGLYDGKSFATLYSKVTLLSSYSQYIRVGNKKWSGPEASTIVGRDRNISDIKVTRENLDNYFMDSSNPQYSIIPILIYEGVNFSVRNEIDELTYIRKSDILPNGLILRAGGDDANARFLELDSETMRMVNIAANQNVFIGYSKRHKNPPISNTGYLLRFIGEDYVGNLTYQGVYRRYTVFQEYTEEVLGVEKVAVTELQNYGKVKMIESLLDGGFSFNEAATETLKRYNEYDYYTPGVQDELMKEKAESRNMTRTSRLKRNFVSYGGKLED